MLLHCISKYIKKYKTNIKTHTKSSGKWLQFLMNIFEKRSHNNNSKIQKNSLCSLLPDWLPAWRRLNSIIRNLVRSREIDRNVLSFVISPCDFNLSKWGSTVLNKQCKASSYSPGESIQYRIQTHHMFLEIFLILYPRNSSWLCLDTGCRPHLDWRSKVTKHFKGGFVGE